MFKFIITIQENDNNEDQKNPLQQLYEFPKIILIIFNLQLGLRSHRTQKNLKIQLIFPKIRR